MWALSFVIVRSMRDCPFLLTKVGSWVEFSMRSRSSSRMLSRAVPLSFVIRSPQAWLRAFESLNGVMANAESVKGKVGEYLRDSLEFLPMSYELATIKKDLELEYSVDELASSKADLEGLLAIFTELEFRPWVNEISSDAPGDTNESPVTSTL